VQRLLVLFHDPYHLRVAEAQAWLEREVASVVRRDQVDRATLTRLGTFPQSRGGFDWLLELGVAPAPETSPRGAVAELVADLRLLGMRPLVAVADDRHSIDLGSE
jgi:hypothetical protein